MTHPPICHSAQRKAVERSSLAERITQLPSPTPEKSVQEWKAWSPTLNRSSVHPQESTTGSVLSKQTMLMLTATTFPPSLPTSRTRFQKNALMAQSVEQSALPTWMQICTLKLAAALTTANRVNVKMALPPPHSPPLMRIASKTTRCHSVEKVHSSLYN